MCRALLWHKWLKGDDGGVLRQLDKCPALLVIFFFQAEDGIRDAQEARGLGDVYKRQEKKASYVDEDQKDNPKVAAGGDVRADTREEECGLSLIHI